MASCGEFLANLWRVLACLTDFLTSFWRVFDEKTHLSNLKCQLKSEIKSQSTLNRQLDIKSYPNHLKSIKIHISSQIILASFWPFLASFASFGEFLEGYWRVLCEFMVSFAKFLARFLVTSWRVIGRFLQVSGELLVSYGHFLSSFWQVFGEFSASFGELGLFMASLCEFL